MKTKIVDERFVTELKKSASSHDHWVSPSEERLMRRHERQIISVNTEVRALEKEIKNLESAIKTAEQIGSSPSYTIAWVFCLIMILMGVTIIADATFSGRYDANFIVGIVLAAAGSLGSIFAAYVRMAAEQRVVELRRQLAITKSKLISARNRLKSTTM